MNTYGLLIVLLCENRVVKQSEKDNETIRN